VYVAPVTRTLLVSIASQAGTDDYGNSFPAGIAQYQSAAVYTVLSEGELAFFGASGQAEGATITSRATGGLLALSSGSVVSGGHQAQIALISTNEGTLSETQIVSDVFTVTGDAVFDGAEFTVGGNEWLGNAAPLGYPLAGTASNAQIVAAFNSLVSTLIDMGIIS
jgi:hypothetical protein